MMCVNCSCRLFMHLTDNLQITVKDFYTVAKKIKESEPDIQHWTFGGYVTQTNLPFAYLKPLVSQHDPTGERLLQGRGFG